MFYPVPSVPPVVRIFGRNAANFTHGMIER